MTHPYREQPQSAFWAKSVSKNWDPRSILGSRLLLRKTDRVASAGSCFAANLVPYLKKGGIQYVEEELRHPAFVDLPYENFSYEKFSAAYGNIYTARQFRQLLERSMGYFSPLEDRWEMGDRIIDPFRPGLKYAAKSHREFDALLSQHLRCVRRAFENATVVIFTLGLTECWVSKSDQAVFPACPGTVAGIFDSNKHEFCNFSVADVVTDLKSIYKRLRELRADIRLILTVSPVPLVATATSDHVLLASSLSKATLRAACSEFQKIHPDVDYFPAFEIVTGPQAPDDFFESDKRSVSQRGIEEVMSAFLSNCEVRANEVRTEDLDPSSNKVRQNLSELSMNLSALECEESASAR